MATFYQSIAAFLLLAALPIPRYDFYVVLRFVVTLAACAALTQAFRNRPRKGFDLLTLAFAMVVVTFNPIWPVHLSKQIWIVIDLASAWLFFRMSIWLPNSSSLYSRIPHKVIDFGTTTVVGIVLIWLTFSHDAPILVAIIGFGYLAAAIVVLFRRR